MKAGRQWTVGLSWRRSPRWRPRAAASKEATTAASTPTRKGAGRVARRRSQPCTGRRTSSCPGADAYERRIASLHGYPVGGQRLGVLVRAVPLRVPDPAEALRRVRQAGRLPRRRQPGLRRRGSDLPRRGPGPLPQLHRPRQRHRRPLGASSASPTPPSTTRRQARLPQAGPVHRPTPNCEADIERYALATCESG